MDGRANPLMDRKLVVIFGVAAVVTSPTTEDVMWAHCNCSCSCSGSCSCSVVVVVAVVVVAVVVVFHYLLPLFCGAQNFHGDQVATERKCGYFVGMHCVGDSFLSFLSILLGMESKLRKKLFNLKERPRISEENKKHTWSFDSAIVPPSFASIKKVQSVPTASGWWGPHAIQLDHQNNRRQVLAWKYTQHYTIVRKFLTKNLQHLAIDFFCDFWFVFCFALFVSLPQIVFMFATSEIVLSRKMRMMHVSTKFSTFVLLPVPSFFFG